HHPFKRLPACACRASSCTFCWSESPSGGQRQKLSEWLPSSQMYPGFGGSRSQRGCLLNREIVELRRVPARAEPCHSFRVARISNVRYRGAVNARLDGRSLENQREVMPGFQLRRRLSRCELARGYLEFCAVKLPC